MEMAGTTVPLSPQCHRKSFIHSSITTARSHGFQGIDLSIKGEEVKRHLFKKPVQAFPWIHVESSVVILDLSLGFVIETFQVKPSHKTFRIKKKLGKKMRQNRPIPYWIRMRTDNTIRYNAKRRHWRRTKLGF
ncbi:hypothetical protein AHAS_Ahas15G0020900 [Arachis hypogaea]